jgi:hypothetical protein
MFNVTIVFWGLIALALPVHPNLKDKAGEARAIFLPAPKHTPTMAIPATDFTSTELAPSYWSKDKKTAYWELSAVTVTLDAQGNGKDDVDVPWLLRAQMINPQEAHPTPPDMDNAGWDLTPALHVTVGNFAHGGVTHTTVDTQLYTYEYKDSNGNVTKSAKHEHPAARSYFLKTKGTKLTLSDAAAGKTYAIQLTKKPTITFSNEMSGGSFSSDHYLSYWEKFFPTTKERYLPVEMFPYTVMTPKDPDRCPPPLAYKKF